MDSIVANETRRAARCVGRNSAASTTAHTSPLPPRYRPGTAPAPPRCRSGAAPVPPRYRPVPPGAAPAPAPAPAPAVHRPNSSGTNHPAHIRKPRLLLSRRSRGSRTGARRSGIRRRGSAASDNR
ncbi:MAG: hypothetical protein DI609_07250 [Corynebacterium urealyticum]|uniref:Uncharacterized protein n=1 Tax=Corynebacterium urealyticum TaxID=43771 RepID=A0A2W5AZM1_9CORY|nr:MAG: hypothetical protein DI609_07250 [Corynebacterium urealyticum]